MDWLQWLIVWLLFAVATKALMGFHFPWEPIIKAKKALAENLEKIKTEIPASIYQDMRKQIDRI